MKKVKIAFWIVIFGFVGLLIYQNRIFFMAESHLVLNLGFFHYETPFLANAVFFVAFFLIGILMTYFLSLFKQFRDAKVIKASRQGVELGGNRGNPGTAASATEIRCRRDAAACKRTPCDG